VWSTPKPRKSKSDSVYIECTAKILRMRPPQSVELQTFRGLSVTKRHVKTVFTRND